MTEAQIIAANTSDAYMADSYGSERWTQEIQELLNAGYNQKEVEWIVRSKIARWADDYEETMIVHIINHLGNDLVMSWIREQA
jgi:hypothetical protein